MTHKHQTEISRTDHKKRVHQHLLVILITMVVIIGIAIPIYIFRYLEPSYSKQLISNLEQYAKHTSDHLVSDGLINIDNLQKGKISPTNKQLLKQTVIDFELWKLRLFDSKGMIIYSSSDEEVGQLNSSNYFNQSVAKGEIYSKLVEKEGVSREGALVPLDVVEVYVPIMDNRKFMGSLEFYYDVTQLAGRLRSLHNKSIWIILGLIIFFSLVSIFITRRAIKATNQQHEYHNKLLEQQALFRDIFTSAGDSIMVTDSELRIHQVNPAFTRITGFTETESLGKTPRIFKSKQQNTKFYKEMWNAINTHGRWQGEVWNRHKNGELYPILLTITRLMDQEGNVSHYIGLGTDITRQKADQESLEWLAQHDHLTHLPNRLLFHDRLTTALRSARRFDHKVGLLFIDLDGFKLINDEVGHDVGDELLIHVGDRLSIALREEDTAARVGGDEFTVILNRITHINDAIQVAEKLVRVIEQPFDLSEGRFNISASIGVAIFPEHAETPDRLLEAADDAMYAAKAAGRNCVKAAERKLQAS